MAGPGPADLAQSPGSLIAVEAVPCPGCGSGRKELWTESMDFDYFTTAMAFRIARCGDCGLLYVDPRPKLSEIGKIYPPEYSAYHFDKIGNPLIRRARSFMQSGKARRILRCLDPRTGRPRIVDVGCGAPALLSLLDRAAPGRLELYGNDFSPEMLAAVERAGFNPMPGAFESVTWESGFFDAVVMNQVIEHLFDVPGNLRKTYDLLRPGGVLFIETPSSEGLDARLFSRRHWGGYHLPRHLQIFDSATIRRTLERYGFSVERIEYLPSPNFWTSSVRNLLIRAGVPRCITRRMNYRSTVCMGIFTSLDLVLRPFFRTSNMRVIARKPRS
jgi:SAM-dependent methyltransferase